MILVAARHRAGESRGLFRTRHDGPMMSGRGQHADALNPVSSLRKRPGMMKKAVFLALVKKTYLTFICLTRVLTNIYKGFVLEKNLFRENVQN
jgi:hypothetical protein